MLGGAGAARNPKGGGWVLAPSPGFCLCGLTFLAGALVSRMNGVLHLRTSEVVWEAPAKVQVEVFRDCTLFSNHGLTVGLVRVVCSLRRSEG